MHRALDNPPANRFAYIFKTFCINLALPFISERNNTNSSVLNMLYCHFFMEFWSIKTSITTNTSVK